MLQSNYPFLKKKYKDFTYHAKFYSVGFSVLGDRENEDDSYVSINNKELFRGDIPAMGGPYDAHMGTTDHNWNCLTCSNMKTICPGHFGLLTLKYPIKSPIFRVNMLKWLKIICSNCGKNIVTKSVNTSKTNKLSGTVKVARDIQKCPHCDAAVKKIHQDKVQPSMFVYEVTTPGGPVNVELLNNEIYNILDKIDDETVLQLGKPIRSHPRKYIITNLRVPPNTIRPDIRRTGGARATTSDITALLKSLVEINELLPEEIPEKNKLNKDLRDMYYTLDATYYEMVRGSTSTNNQVRLLTTTNKIPNSIANHIPKKYGRIRRNLMGKRVSNMMRSVITGDGRLKIDEVGVPINIATSIQVPEVCRPYNRELLKTYFNNKTNIYPGCSRIIKVQDGQQYKATTLKDYQLQDGDIVLRDIITGDVMNFNRQPSLTFASIAAHRIVVLDKGNTLRMNVSACSGYNADFDGDNMNGLMPLNIMSRNEIEKMSRISNWFISYKTGGPLMGAFQDTLIGIAELTRYGNTFNKWHSMCLLSQIDFMDKDILFDKKCYTNRELVSMILPNINLVNKKPKIYMEQYNPFIKYNKEDINVYIDKGNLIQGILDKSTIGQEQNGTIFHIINNEYGSQAALNTIYSFQQIATQFLYYQGYTVGINDINISKETTKTIKENTAKMIFESRSITEKLNKGKLVAPIGMLLREYYEILQLDALTPGDDFVEPILSNIHFETNGIAKLVFTGSKGKPSNVIAINAAPPTTTINGRRPLKNFGWERTSPYFLRYDTEPDSLGFISNSYREGVPSDVFLFTAGEARHGLISNALNTSITGHQNRLSVKNLESILVDNLYKSSKGNNVIQPLYAETGIDPRCNERVKFNHAMISDEEFVKTYKCSLNDVLKKYRTDKVKLILAQEFEQLQKDREEFRLIFMTLESHNLNNFLMDNTIQMPVNVYRIIEDTIFNYKDEMVNMTSTLNPANVVEKVTDLCFRLPYLYMNEIQENRKSPIPTHFQKAVTLLRILIRSYLCCSYMIKKGLNDQLLDVIITKIRLTFKKSLVDYGKAVGIIAAQCISEPMTQYVLDSKHRAGGGGGTKTNTIVRVKEILGAKPTNKMKNTSMLLMPLEQFEYNKSKVQEIANHIEMLPLDRFIISSQIFFEDFGKPIHPRFKEESVMINRFVKHNFGMVITGDITKWCIRFELNREEMVLKSMKIETMVMSIRSKFPYLFIVYSAENDDKLILRCYIKQGMLKKILVENEEPIIKIMYDIKNVIIRGVEGIYSTEVINIVKSKKEVDGRITSGIVYGIHTNGTNLEEVIDQPLIDQFRSQTDSILEFESMYGIEAARNKIIFELSSTMEINKVHGTIYADEMTYSGQVTSIQRTGLQKREMSNVLLRLSFQSPIQVAQSSAVDGLIDKIGGISAPLMLGMSPSIGTTYNKILIDHEFIRKHKTILSEELDDL